MSRAIWKVTASAYGSHYTSLPCGARFLDLQVQYDAPTTWWLVDPDAPVEAVTLTTLVTGTRYEEVVDEYEYLGTFQLISGRFVGHLFRETT